jgi:hypothetical protein
MSVYELFLCGAASKEQVVRDAERMVKFAAEPVIPGEIAGAQIRNASERLQLDYGLVRRAWYGLAGPKTYPIIYNAWAALIERTARQQRTTPWRDPQPIRDERRALPLEGVAPQYVRHSRKA